MSRLAGKIALVTGASQGIGSGIARRFGAEGAAVVVHHTDDPAGAARVVAEIVWRGGQAIAVQGDVTRWQDVRRIYEETAATFGRLDILVNNSDRTQGTVLAKDTVLADNARWQLELQVFGTMLMCQEAIRLFGEDGGSVINLTSPDNCTMAPDAPADASADAAIDAMMRGLSRAYGTRNVRVSSIAPGVLGPEEPAVIDVLDGSIVNRQFIALPAAGHGRTPDAIAEIAVSLGCDDYAFRQGGQIMAANAWQ